MNLMTLFRHHGVNLVFIFFLLGICSGLSAQASPAADTIAHILKFQKNETQACDELYKVGNYYWNIGDFENAQEVMIKCKELSIQYNYDKGIFDAMSILGAINLRKNDFVKPRSISKEMLKLADKNHSEYGANRANYLLVMVYYQQRKMDSVIYLSKKVLEAHHIVYDSATLPKFAALLANAYGDKGDVLTANTYYLEALTIAEKTNNEQLQAICLGNLSMINEGLRNYRLALQYRKKSLAVAIKNNQMDVVAGCYNSLGNVYMQLGVQDSAIYFFNLSIPLHYQMGDAGNVAFAHNQLGTLMMYQHQLDSALFYLQLAKQEYTLLHDTGNIIKVAISLGDGWLRMTNEKNDKSYIAKALQEFYDGKALTEKKGMVDLKMSCYKYLAISYDALGDSSRAYRYFRKYYIINDSIRSTEYTGQIAEMQTKYETEKKQNEITRLSGEKLLDAEKIERQRTLNYSLMGMAGLILVSGFSIFKNVQRKRTAEKQVAILEKQNAIESMRSKIASDVHDEMGANLTRLGLNAQQLLSSANVAEKEKHILEKMSIQSKDIITGMREIIWASNPANDNLKSMLGFMRQYIDRFFDGTNIRPIVNFPHDVGEISLHPEVRRNLFLILKESLNNAVKYSGTDKIDIDFNNDTDNFSLHIKDYGKGIDEKAKDEFSNGLGNMQMRAQQIQSLFKLITAPGEGVQITVEGKLY